MRSSFLFIALRSFVLSCVFVFGMLPMAAFGLPTPGDEAGGEVSRQKKLFLLYAFEEEDPRDDYVVKLSHDLRERDKDIDAYTAIERGANQNLHHFFEQQFGKLRTQENQYVALCCSRILMAKYLNQDGQSEPIVVQEINAIISYFRVHALKSRILFFLLDGEEQESIPAKLNGNVYKVDFREKGGFGRVDQGSGLYKSRLNQVVSYLKEEGAVSSVEEGDGDQSTRKRGNKEERSAPKRHANAVAAAAAAASSSAVAAASSSSDTADELLFFGHDGVLQPNLASGIFSFRESIMRQVTAPPVLKCLLCYRRSVDSRLLERLQHNIRVGGVEVAGVDLDAQERGASFERLVADSQMVVMLKGQELDERATGSSFSKHLSVLRRVIASDGEERRPLCVLTLDGCESGRWDHADSSLFFHHPLEQWLHTFKLIQWIYKVGYSASSLDLDDADQEVRDLSQESIDNLRETFKVKLESCQKREDYKKMLAYLKRNAMKKRDASHDSDALFKAFYETYGKRRGHDPIEALYAKVIGKSSKAKEEEQSISRRAVSENFFKAGFAFKDIGLLFQKLKLHALAREAYQQATVLLDKTSGEVRNGVLAFCHYSLGRLFYKQLVEEDKSDEDKVLVSANYRKAFGHFVQALNLNPNDAYTAYYTARLFLDKRIEESKRLQLPSNQDLLKTATEARKNGSEEKARASERRTRGAQRGAAANDGEWPFVLRKEVHDHALKLLRLQS